MGAIPNEIAAKIKSLTDIEKIKLVDYILMQLDKPDPEIDRIWIDEARKRWLAYKTGKAETVPHDQVKALSCSIFMLQYSQDNLRGDKMARKIILRQMGGSIGATIPKEIAERFHLNKGDEVFVSETDKGILITPYDPNFDKAMAVYEKGAKKYRNALRELSQIGP